MCTFGDRCRFAHGEADLRPMMMMSADPSSSASDPASAAEAHAIGRSAFKTQLCRHFLQHGECTFGPYCTFAHGPQELRRRR